MRIWYLHRSVRSVITDRVLLLGQLKYASLYHFGRTHSCLYEKPCFERWNQTKCNNPHSFLAKQVLAWKLLCGCNFIRESGENIIENIHRRYAGPVLKKPRNPSAQIKKYRKSVPIFQIFCLSWFQTLGHTFSAYPAMLWELPDFADKQSLSVSKFRRAVNLNYWSN